ncbi:MAG: Lrp/AsnC family transcriptional regulator [Candidatus Thorarchaeota archaeon]|nr:Lrp/AsnC family transcriptional regulator [Candidatus Thorarchaeota archaeon]
MTEKSSEKTRMKLDGFDYKILTLLQKNGRMTYQEISKEIGKGISTVHNRVKALEDAGVIKGFAAILDGFKVGRPTVAMVLITVRYRVPGRKTVISQREFCDEVAQHPLVQSVHVLSGEYDVMLKVRTHDVDEMNSFIVDFLRQMPAVDKTLTMFVMDTYRDTNEIRLTDSFPRVEG